MYKKISPHPKLGEDYDLAAQQYAPHVNVLQKKRYHCDARQSIYYILRCGTFVNTMYVLIKNL